MIDINLLEASLTRVWQHYEDKNRVFAILTAFRGEYDFDENKARNSALASDIRNLGYGFFYLDGYWIENEGTDNERRVKEDSLFVSTQNTKDFAKNILSLGKKYNQEAVVVKDEEGARLLFSNGDTMNLGDLKPGKMGDIYSQLRGKGNRTFIFESERDDLGWIQRLAGLTKG
jgi:hypothetical protein